MIRVRPAVSTDLSGIMEVEVETFGEEMSASKETMEDRIKKCNCGEAKWFFVAENDEQITGDMILQPTKLLPEECTSWPSATDDGTMQRTFDRKGPNIYVVSLASRPGYPGTSELLMHAALTAWAEHKKGDRSFFMFCSRMPGFGRMNRNTGVTPEVYWRLRHAGGPRDPMLRLYWEMSGKVWPARLLKNGFPPDSESSGHGVLFVLDDPFRALYATAERLYQAGLRSGSQGRES